MQQYSTLPQWALNVLNHNTQELPQSLRTSLAATPMAHWEDDDLHGEILECSLSTGGTTTFVRGVPLGIETPPYLSDRAVSWGNIPRPPPPPIFPPTVPIPEPITRHTPQVLGLIGQMQQDQFMIEQWEERGRVLSELAQRQFDALTQVNEMIAAEQTHLDGLLMEGSADERTGEHAEDAEMSE